MFFLRKREWKSPGFPFRGTTCRASGDLVGFWVGWGQRLSGRSIVGSVRAPGALLPERQLVDGRLSWTRLRPGFKVSVCALACGDERACVWERRERVVSDEVQIAAMVHNGVGV